MTAICTVFTYAVMTSVSVTCVEWKGLMLMCGADFEMFALRLLWWNWLLCFIQNSAPPLPCCWVLLRSMQPVNDLSPALASRQSSERLIYRMVQDEVPRCSGPLMTEREEYNGHADALLAAIASGTLTTRSLTCLKQPKRLEVE